LAGEHKQKALESAQEFVKYLVVLSTGVLGFALAMLPAVPQNTISFTTLLAISSILLAVSIFLGVLAYGTLVSQLYDDKIDFGSRRLTFQAQGQWILFFAGVVVLGAALFVRSFL
jgi:hypothetical protein